MKKAVIALSIACAGALAFADTAQWQSPWITGIGSNATAKDALDVKNGSWTFPTDADAVTFTETAKTLTFDLGDDEEGKFTVTEAATEKTAQKLTVTGVFTPCSATDLSTGAAMNEKSAQIGFAVVSTGDTTTPYKYYAWIGKTDGATAEGGTAISDWVEVGACADATQSTTLTINFSYWGGTPKVSFSAVNGTSAAVTLNDQSLTSTAASANKVSSIACTGSGTLSALSGDAGIAVATVGDVPYATVDDAITAVTANGGTIEINATPSGEVTSDNTDKFDATKECVVTKSGETTTVTVQPKTSILEAITINDVALKANVSKLRTFLSENCSGVYTGADSTTEKFQEALAKTPENKNGLALWQDYALGIAPDTKLAMGYATDTATDGVTLALATAVTPSGDYTITYKCSQVGGTTTAESTDASAIKLPLTTGRYKVNVVFSAPAADTSDGDDEEVQ